MKSGLWLVGIFLFGILAMAALFVFNAFLLVFQLYPLPLVISVLAAAGSERLFGKLRRKYGFSAWVFWILAFLPHVIIGTGAVAAIYVELKMDIYTLYALTLGLPYGISSAIFTYLSAKKLKEEQQ